MRYQIKNSREEKGGESEHRMGYVLCRAPGVRGRRKSGCLGFLKWKGLYVQDTKNISPDVVRSTRKRF